MTVRSVSFVVAAACCVFAELAILRSLLFGRAREAEQHPVSSALAQAPRPHRSAEVAWALLPAIGLFFVLYLTWRAIDVPPTAAPDVSHIGATIGV